MDSKEVDNISQLFDGVHRKRTLFQIQVESMLSEGVEDLLEMSKIFLPRCTENHDVVEVENNTFAKKRLKNVIHVSHESCRFVG